MFKKNEWIRKTYRSILPESIRNKIYNSILKPMKEEWAGDWRTEWYELLMTLKTAIESCDEPDSGNTLLQCSHNNVMAVLENPRQLRLCGNCGVLFVEQVYVKQNWEKRYDSDYYLGRTEFPFFENGELVMYRNYKNYYDKVFKHIGFLDFETPTRKSIELGCAVGPMLLAMRDWGFDPCGIDLSEWAVNYCRYTLGLHEVHCGTLLEMNMEESFYGVALMIHTIEHLKNPNNELREMFRILAPGGRIYVQTGDHSRDIEDIFDEDHLWMFDKHSLTYLLRSVGFENVKTYQEGVEWNYIEEPHPSLIGVGEKPL